MSKRISSVVIIIFLTVNLLSCDDKNASNLQNENAPVVNIHADNEDHNEKEQGTVVDYSLIDKYLLENNVSIDMNAEHYDKNLAFLDEEVDSKDIFFTAEVHGVEANSLLKMQFVKYFKERTNFKYLLTENSYSASFFLNQYLLTGDTSILDMLFHAQKGTYANSDENYMGWVSLYEYNNTLDVEDRIKVVGVDIEHQVVIAYNYMISVLPDKEVPAEIENTVQLIRDTLETLNSTFTQDHIARKNSNIILENIEEHRDIYQEYLGDELVFFELVNSNVINAKEAYKHVNDKTEWNKVRDQMIYDSFLTVDRQLEEGKYYGQWGLNHTFQEAEGQVKWFAAFLNSEGSKYQDKVLSIVYNYENCESMGRGNQDSMTLNIKYPFIENVSSLVEGDTVIYKLNGDKTDKPFIPMYISWTGEESDIDVSEFFQYILLIKNSKASKSRN